MFQHSIHSARWKPTSLRTILNESKNEKYLNIIYILVCYFNTFGVVKVDFFVLRRRRRRRHCCHRFILLNDVTWTNVFYACVRAYLHVNVFNVFVVSVHSLLTLRVPFHLKHFLYSNHHANKYGSFETAVFWAIVCKQYKYEMLFSMGIFFSMSAIIITTFFILYFWSSTTKFACSRLVLLTNPLLLLLLLLLMPALLISSTPLPLPSPPSPLQLRFPQKFPQMYSASIFIVVKFSRSFFNIHTHTFRIHWVLS